jgi:hypothetical protein
VGVGVGAGAAVDPVTTFEFAEYKAKVSLSDLI